MLTSRLLGLSAALLCVAAAPSSAAEVAAAQVPTNQAQAMTSQPQAQAAQEKKICKQLPSSYSRMTKRACLTDKEWKQVDADIHDNGY